MKTVQSMLTLSAMVWLLAVTMPIWAVGAFVGVVVRAFVVGYVWAQDL